MPQSGRALQRESYFFVLDLLAIVEVGQERPELPERGGGGRERGRREREVERGRERER